MNRCRSGWRSAGVLGLVVLASAITWCAGLAFAGRQGDDDEKRVRQAGFRYYSGVILGDVEQCLAAVRTPMFSIRNGVWSQRDEKAMRALVASIAQRSGLASLSTEERNRMGTNMLAVFNEATIQFIGGNTASLVFVVRPRANAQSGDHLGALLLYRTGAAWQVIGEITDSTPVPPEEPEAATPPDKRP